MSPPFSRGFHRRHAIDPEQADRVPPGQHVVGDFPVLSYGPTPHTPLDQWSFQITGAMGEPMIWSWEEFRELPTETITRDIHCVTSWSKLGTSWEGVSVDTLLEGIETEAQARMLRHLGYTFGQGYLYSRPLPPHAVAERAAAGLAVQRSA